MGGDVRPLGGGDASGWDTLLVCTDPPPFLPGIVAPPLHAYTPARLFVQLQSFTSTILPFITVANKILIIFK